MPKRSYSPLPTELHARIHELSRRLDIANSDIGKLEQDIIQKDNQLVMLRAGLQGLRSDSEIADIKLCDYAKMEEKFMADVARMRSTGNALRQAGSFGQYASMEVLHEWDAAVEAVSKKIGEEV